LGGDNQYIVLQPRFGTDSSRASCHAGGGVASSLPRQPPTPWDPMIPNRRLPRNHTHVLNEGPLSELRALVLDPDFKCARFPGPSLRPRRLPPLPPFPSVPCLLGFPSSSTPPATSTPAGTCVLSSSSSSPSSPHLLLVPSAPCRTQPIGSPLLPPITYLFLRRIHRSPFRRSLLVPPPLGIAGCYRVVIGSPGFVASNLCLCQPRAATIFFP
jgi:hypothetical protein